jgi:hypothetical protein
MMGSLTFIVAVALAAAFVLIVVGLVAVIIYYRCRLKDSHRTLARFIKENIALREMKNTPSPSSPLSKD